MLRINWFENEGYIFFCIWWYINRYIDDYVYNNWLIFESSIIHSLEWDVWMKNARAVIQDICGLQNFVAFGTMLFS